MASAAGFLRNAAIGAFQAAAYGGHGRISMLTPRLLQEVHVFVPMVAAPACRPARFGTRQHRRALAVGAVL